MPRAGPALSRSRRLPGCRGRGILTPRLRDLDPSVCATPPSVQLRKCTLLGRQISSEMHRSFPLTYACFNVPPKMRQERHDPTPNKPVFSFG
jgi:hypothetical protein